MIEGIGEPMVAPYVEPDQVPPATDEIQIAIDERTDSASWSGTCPRLKGPAIFAIVKLLAEISLNDRSKPGRTERYTCLRGREIADRLSFSDEGAIRAAIKRARAELKEAVAELGWDGDASQALIESTDRGYRLNPKVRIVEPDDINRG